MNVLIVAIAVPCFTSLVVTLVNYRAMHSLRADMNAGFDQLDSLMNTGFGDLVGKLRGTR
jgi:hypothetical protein